MRPEVLKALDDARLMADLRALLAEGEGRIELGGRMIEVPPSTALQVVARSYHTYEVETSFGDHYRALLAVGGIASIDHGVVTPVICFATTWYSADLRLITVDFSEGMP